MHHTSSVVLTSFQLVGGPALISPLHWDVTAHGAMQEVSHHLLFPVLTDSTLIPPEAKGNNTKMHLIAPFFSTPPSGLSTTCVASI